jgi:protein gp37
LISIDVFSLTLTAYRLMSLHMNALDLALRRKIPEGIFGDSVTDLFHEAVTHTVDIRSVAGVSL